MVSPASLVLRDIATNPASARAFTAIVETVQSRGLHLTDLHPSDIELLRVCAYKPKVVRRRKAVAKARFSIKAMRKQVQLKRHPKAPSVPRVHTCATAEDQLRYETQARMAGRGAPKPQHCSKCEAEKSRLLLSFCVAMEVGDETSE